MTPKVLLAEIESEADRIRTDGSLPAGFERELAERFEKIAADPAALWSEAALLGTGAGGAASSSGVRGVSRRIARGAARRARGPLGPPVRRMERLALRAAGSIGEELSVRAASASDTARRALLRPPVARAAGLFAERSPLSPPMPAALELGAGGLLADEMIDAFVLERLQQADRGELLHAECGDGSLVERLFALGFVARGYDPVPGHGGARRGALEALGSARRSSLAAVILSGLPDRATRARGRAVASLAASRLAPGGVLVLFSKNPSATTSADPVSSDLAPGGPFHQETWRQLLSEAGVGEIEVAFAKDESAYALLARRPGR